MFEDLRCPVTERCLMSRIEQILGVLIWIGGPILGATLLILAIRAVL